MFLLKILRNLFDAGKCLSTKARNLRPTLVFTFLLYGGLNHIIFLDLFVVGLLVIWDLRPGGIQFWC